ncbi:hypothetical protein C7C56_021175 [Massilia glaciei]|uniref:TonB-dependent receptor plug domain-containing protein n=1 Tax=Massilia glaciei TaxID=1524097 RepID=A0A2U2HFV7_9BURK|nr:hypothetical protein C7C56_021175 [Massilia glaciei]
MSPARAQEGNTPADPRPGAAPARLEQVEVRGTAAGRDARRAAAAGMVVISHDEIIKHGDANIVDVLGRLPGVTARGADVRMRGLGSGYTQILINGERAPAGFALDALAPELIERVEVLRGQRRVQRRVDRGHHQHRAQKRDRRGPARGQARRRHGQAAVRAGGEPATGGPQRAAVVFAVGQRARERRPDRISPSRAAFQSGRRPRGADRIGVRPREPVAPNPAGAAPEPDAPRRRLAKLAIVPVADPAHRRAGDPLGARGGPGLDLSGP